ncbi:uncharacterized protein G2W53_041226 [Senna tora]|uniref:Uncharacterized protein n=1 Tax=Senna tora TaxID=362788 RepID=A0A834VZ04_9FABA|nr:uncharacterized protein G2W53_041226 [Senna tora]
MAWKERASSLNLFRYRNSSRMSEMFTKYNLKVLLRKWVKSIGSLCICETEWI